MMRMLSIKTVIIIVFCNQIYFSQRSNIRSYPCTFWVSFETPKKDSGSLKSNVFYTFGIFFV